MLQWMRQRKRKLTCVGALQAYMWWLIHYSVITSWMHTLLYKFHKVLFLLDNPIYSQIFTCLTSQWCLIIISFTLVLYEDPDASTLYLVDLLDKYTSAIWYLPDLLTFMTNIFICLLMVRWQSFLFCFTCLAGWWPEARPRSAPPRWWRTSRSGSCCSSHLSWGMCFRA